MALMESDKTESEVVYGRLKLEIPNGGDDVQVVPPHASAQKTLLEECLKERGIIFEDPPLRTVLEEPGCEKFRVYNYEIKSHFLAKHLLAAIRLFLNSIQAQQFPHHFKATIIIHSPSCFSNHVVSCNRYIPLAAVFFGNIQGGVFINHWEVSFRNGNEARELEKRVAGSSLMRVDFLYDQNEIICVTFENKERSKTYSGEKVKKYRDGTAYYQITLRLGFIRRIIVDNAVNDRNGKNRTRIHFELNCPAVIRRGFVPDSEKSMLKNVKHERWLTIKRGCNPDDQPHPLAFADSPVFTIEFSDVPSDATIYAILSRLRVRSDLSIEFASYEVVNKLYILGRCPYATWTGSKCNEKVNAATDGGDLTIVTFLKDTIRRVDCMMEGIKANKRPADIMRERSFSLLYLIECLISRGAVVKDQLLLDKAVWIDFLHVLNYCYRDGRDACLFALERVITMIDERKRIGSVLIAFTKEYEFARGYSGKADLSLEEIREGYRRVRKIVITQTRVIYVVPETIMANRVLRSYDSDGTRFIRVTFRDDDNQAMRTSKTSKALIERTLGNFLKVGLHVADRWFGYLGSSNSQMRDSGAYFMEKYSRSQLREYKEIFNRDPPPNWQPKIDDARVSLGRFTTMESIPKLMARLGQCFTQSMKTSVPLRREQYRTDYDFIGGSNKQGKEYTFSDGVGMISFGLATEIAKDMSLGKCVPSCYQFRFRGMKGVVAVNPMLDEIASWAKKYTIRPPNREFGSWDLKLIFRPSQIKFDAKRTEKDSLEIVKYSAPVPVSLNKPFICILDQVSEMQSYECHSRVTNRIEELLDLQLRTMARTMLREHDCRNKLKELPRRIDIDSLSIVCGFQLSTEPFFRSLIKATIKYAVTKQMRKQQIQIPFDKGRTMLGVVDETGQLQYGQVFVQYTENLNLKTPPPNAAKKIVTGKVLLTKNPCIVAGDVRVFEAVDIPDLRHLCDVIVFPMHGPRPHPDEMAGSDLDGDEYAVIWDQELLLDRNEEPFDYTAEKPKTRPIDAETISEDMVDFYISYITQDSVGTISNSFLFQADLYGITSEVCLRLARKISQAVDFTKTGLPPAPLVKNWTIDEETGKEIPPEKSERQPDFHFGNDYDPTYRSPRLMGRIFRGIKAIEDVLRISEDIDEQEEVEMDRYLTLDGWMNYKEAAEEQLSKYKGGLRAIMENYGIKTEGEIFSGCICEMRNRISDRDQDDMSFYNTNEVIEKKVTNFFKEFRIEFFQEFGGWENCTKKMDKKFAVEDNIFHRLVHHPPVKMQQKAIAYYRVCYETAQQTRERILSFAWLPYDVLAVVRQENVLQQRDCITVSTPLYEMLKQRVAEYLEENNAKFFSFMEFHDNEAVYQLKIYTKRYPGLGRVMFIISEWADRNGLFTGRLQSHHICLILILYATGRIVGSSINHRKPFFESLEGLNTFGNQEAEEMEEEQQIELFVAFFEYLASREFRKLPHLSFEELQYASVFLRGEWIPLHEAAVKTYYNMVFNLRFDEMSDDPQIIPRSLTVRECEPFVIELPEDINDKRVQQRIMEKTGVDEVALRRLNCKQEGRVAVSARGTVQSLRALRELVTVKPLIKTAARGKEISEQLCRLTYENIMR